MTARTVTTGSGVDAICMAGSEMPTGCHQAPSAVSVGSGHSSSMVSGVDRCGDPHAESERTGELDPGARVVERSLAAVAVVQLRRGGVERDLERDAVAVERFERAAARAAMEDHRVGQDRDRRPADGLGGDGRQLGHEERLAAGEQRLAAAEAGELLARPAHDVQRQPPRARARRGHRAAVVAGEIAVEVRVEPQPRAQRRRVARCRWHGVCGDGGHAPARYPAVWAVARAFINR